ncbi:unnamed protein product [Rhizophagus irregularis]|nr:unnamed protein product [Rhizophagus irregularis]
MKFFFRDFLSRHSFQTDKRLSRKSFSKNYGKFYFRINKTTARVLPSIDSIVTKRCARVQELDIQCKYDKFSLFHYFSCGNSRWDHVLIHESDETYLHMVFADWSKANLTLAFNILTQSRSRVKALLSIIFVN